MKKISTHYKKPTKELERIFDEKKIKILIDEVLCIYPFSQFAEECLFHFENTGSLSKNIFYYLTKMKNDAYIDDPSSSMFPELYDWGE